MVLGLAALFGAIGLQTIWAPPTTLTASTDGAAVDAPADAPLTVITGGINEVDGAADEAVEYSLTGEGDYTVMLGQTRDIEAWVGEAAHNTVTGIETEVPDGQDLRVVVEHTEGEATVPDPAGSDLWVDLQEASGTIDQRWSVPSEGEWALLVAADGTEPAPAEMTVTWTNMVGDSPWIVPLFVIGALLILLGLALLVWALLRRRRGHPGGGSDTAAGRPAPAPTRPNPSPRSPDQPRGMQARAAGAVIGVLVMTGGWGAGPATADDAGSSPDGAPSAEAPAGGQDEPYPIVTDSQLERILGQVAAVVEAGDAAQDAGELEARVGGQSLAMRSANYENRELSEDVQAAAPIAAGPVKSVVAEADPAFPRTLAAVTEGEGNSTPQFLVLRQESAREQYKLVTDTPMTPGAQLPASDLSYTGAETIASDDGTGLVMSPGQAVAGLARYLTDPEADFAGRMTQNPAIKGIHEYQAGIEEAAPDATMYISRNAVPEAATALRLADGSALVFSTIDAQMAIAPSEAGGKVVVDDLAAARAGEDSNESSTRVRMTYREVVALHVPAEGAAGDDAKISLVGLTDELESVSYD